MPFSGSRCVRWKESFRCNFLLVRRSQQGAAMCNAPKFIVRRHPNDADMTLSTNLMCWFMPFDLASSVYDVIPMNDWLRHISCHIRQLHHELCRSFEWPNWLSPLTLSLSMWMAVITIRITSTRIYLWEFHKREHKVSQSFKLAIGRQCGGVGGSIPMSIASYMPAMSWWHSFVWSNRVVSVHCC